MPFEQECTVLGFTEDTNPFIGFLKKYLIAFDISASAYTALHDATANEEGLSLADIAGKGPLGETHPIFCKDLYRKSADDIKDYLKWQRTIYYSAESKLSSINPATETGLKKTIADNIYKCSKDKVTEGFLYGKLDAAGNKADDLPDSAEALKLNDLEDINRWYIACVGFEGQVEAHLPWDDMASDELLKLITNKKDATTALYWLSLRFPGKQGDEIRKTYGSIAAPAIDDDFIKMMDKLNNKVTQLGMTLSFAAAKGLAKAFFDGKNGRPTP